jgi:hypothetical protein
VHTGRRIPKVRKGKRGAGDYPQLAQSQLDSAAGKLYVSNADGARDRALLAHLDIAAVVSVGGGHGAESTPSIAFLHFGIKDRSEADYLPILREASAFAAPFLAGGQNVMVHCLRGMHRSPTVAAGMLVSIVGLSGPEARQMVQASRPAVDFAAHLASQIDAFEAECTGGIDAAAGAAV